MDIRYQIFVSSTYEDLQEERAEVMQALLELDCMPAGMELFPAASEEQWRWITRVIDESDYYLVVIGGKYGSINKSTGLSYTEMEYRYALEAGKPCIGFVLDKSVDLPVSKAETDAEKKALLEAFKGLAQTKLCKFWSSTPDLGAKVSRSVTQLIKRVPATGWVRADQVARSNNEEVLSLKNQILELERTLDLLRRSDDTGDLARGEDQLELHFTPVVRNVIKAPNGSEKVQNSSLPDVAVSTTWNEIAGMIALVVLSNGSEPYVEHAIELSFAARVLSVSAKRDTAIPSGARINLIKQDFLQIKLQFIALGYITIEEVHGDNRYFQRPTQVPRWVPTQDGRLYFGRQTALKRQSEG